jgi:type 1 glutamine amidotransferase
MKTFPVFLIIIFSVLFISPVSSDAKKPIRILVMTGGHVYDKAPFNEMLAGLGKNITSQVVEFPAAFDQFLPENRGNYDVLVFYHRWQKITPEQEKIFAECIRDGKPLVVLHHSICAFDDWTEYQNITGGRYFHKPTTVNGKEYATCKALADIHFKVNIVNKKHPVTKGVKDYEAFDETYKGYYVANGVEPLLSTTEKSSNTVIGWTWHYGQARVVTLQSGHAAPTYRNTNFRKLLRQAIVWVNAGSK